jgi:[ribosomal protein S5]-alanine N-acetyltransferase
VRPSCGWRPPDQLHTERLILRRPREEDAEALFHAYAQDAEVLRYLTWLPHRTVEETRALVRRALEEWEEGRTFRWVVVRRREDRPIGMVELRPDGHRLELGYVLARRYWNRGYMTEAVQAVVTWALAQPEIHRVWAVVDVDNRASARVLEKAGMQREGVLRRWSVHPNLGPLPRDCACYSAVKPEGEAGW